MAFSKQRYLQDIKFLVDKAVERMRIENPKFNIYTASVWTDPNAAVSCIGFDSKKNSLKCVRKSNRWKGKYYQQFIKEGDIEYAELFKPKLGTRVCNPANFELRNFEEIDHPYLIDDWVQRSRGKCWNKLEPVLIEIGEYAFQEIQSLNVHEDFEFAVNSRRDWYDRRWTRRG